MAWIVVQYSERQAEFLRPRGEPGEEVRAADGAEASELAGRRFVKAGEFFTSHPLEVGGSHTPSGPEGAAMRLAAHRAVAEQHVPDGAVDFKDDALAQTTGTKRHRTSYERGSACINSCKAGYRLLYDEGSPFENPMRTTTSWCTGSMNTYCPPAPSM